MKRMFATIIYIGILNAVTSGVLSETVLSPSVAEVIEDGDITLTCTNDGNSTLSSRWKSSLKPDLNPVIGLSDSTCYANGYLNNETLYSWTCFGNNTFSLTINNVQKSMDGVYWCCWQNNELSNNVSIYVNEKATIDEFYVLGHEHLDTVEADENVTVVFICISGSQPLADLKLTFEKETLKYEQNATSIVYFLNNTSCHQAGTYTCSGNNQLNDGNVPSKHLNLRVKCSPRPTGDVPVNLTFYTSVNKEMTFIFTAIAYPLPSFEWHKVWNQTWSLVENDNFTSITTSGLQSFLTIKNVSQGDYGEYILTVWNDVGSYEQTYFLLQAEVPAKPRDFKIVNVTKSEIIVQWEPGFSGGPLQTFVLSNKRSTAKKWKNVTIPDKGEVLIQYTVNGLKNGTEYMLILSAINRFGSSDETDVLTIDTLETEVALYKPLEEAIHLHYIIVGCVAIFVALVLIIAIVVFRKRRKPLRQMKKENNNNNGNKNAAKKQRGKNRHLQNSTDQQAKVAGPIPAYEEMEIKSGACQIQQKQDQTYEDIKTGRLAPIKVLVDEKTTKQQKRENFEEAGDLSGEYTLLKVGSQVANNEENGNITRESSRYSTLKLTEYTNLKLFDGGNNPEQKKKETQPKDAGEISGEYTLLKVGSEAAGNKENGNKTDENSRYSTLKMTEYTNLKY